MWKDAAALQAIVFGWIARIKLFNTLFWQLRHIFAPFGKHALVAFVGRIPKTQRALFGESFRFGVSRIGLTIGASHAVGDKPLAQIEFVVKQNKALSRAESVYGVTTITNNLIFKARLQSFQRALLKFGRICPKWCHIEQANENISLATINIVARDAVTPSACHFSKAGMFAMCWHKPQAVEVTHIDNAS